MAAPTTLSLSNSAARTVAADVLIVGSRPGQRNTVLIEGTGLTADGADLLHQRAIALGATGKSGERITITGDGIAKAGRIIVLGYGESTSLETVREIFGATIRGLSGTNKVAICLLDNEYLEAAATGALLGAYAYEAPGLSAAKRPSAVKEIVFLGVDGRSSAAKTAIPRATIIADAVNLTRDLANMPPSALPPAQLEAVTRALIEDSNVRIEVLDEKQLATGGYGGLTGVGKGSINPPRLIKLTYSPRGAKSHLALVGKGITFDSGGISLKPPASMETMKADMAGAAAVIAATIAIADLGIKTKVTCYAACAENMPSGNALRPGDVITILDGTTVEILNTDAEGRLVLADALVRASKDKPDAIVDVATLTGAQRIALGKATGIMGTEAFRDRVFEVSKVTGEAMWPMPITDDLRATLDSPVADLKNIGEKGGPGMLSAAAFLREFVAPGIEWAHLDIATPSYNEGGASGYTPKGGTGAAVRTLIALAEDMAG